MTYSKTPSAVINRETSIFPVEPKVYICDHCDCDFTDEPYYAYGMKFCSAECKAKEIKLYNADKRAQDYYSQNTKS